MKRSSGFTLIETILSVTILAIIGTLIYGAFAQTALNKKHLEQRLDRQRIIQLALERMTREMSMAFVSTHINPSPMLQTSRTAFIGEDHGHTDRIDFTSFSHRRLFRDAHESDQNELSYFVANHPDDSSIKVLARREENRIDDEPQRGGKVEILIEDIEEFELEYLDPLTVEWVRSWDTTQPIGQPNRLPAQVKVRLTVPNPRRPSESLTFGTRAVLPMPYALNHANYNP